MNKGSPLVRWLATLDGGRLADILVRRPDTLTPPPRNVSDLAGRLQTRDSVALAFEGLPLPAVQVIEVMQYIGGGGVSGAAGNRALATLDRLAEVLGRPPDDPDLAATLSALAQRALVWPGPDGRTLHMTGPLWSALPHPLRLGAPAERLLHPLPAAELGQIATTLGLPTSRNKKDALRAVCRRLADTEAVRSLVEGAPKDARELLVDTAWNGPLVLTQSGYGRRATPAVDWAASRGLLVPDGWQHAQMPAEVGRALRGPQWHPRLDARPPEPALAPTESAAVTREATAAATTAVERVAVLLDACAATPVAVLKSGGVGVRELRRLAKATGCDELEARLWLELAYAAGLVAPVREQVLPTEAYDQWCIEEPAARLIPLLRAWLRLPAAPLTAQTPDGGGPSAALVRDHTGLVAYDLRPQVLSVAGELPEGHGVKAAASIEEVLRWRAPLVVRAVPGGGELISGLWQEACLLGVVAHGALTPLGRALLDNADDLRTLAGPDSDNIPPGPEHNPHRLEQVAAQLLPAAVRTAMFQADLTVVVPGVPAADLAALLDAAADRESRGGAATWRFSPASVRRALDTGRDSAALVAELRGYAVGGALPQPLQYLITDVARQHGAIRVRSAGCVLYAEDPALLAEVASVRSLSGLGLAVLAPTVLVSAKPADETLAALRGAGYAPIGEAADGTARIEKATRRRAPTPRRQPPRYPTTRASKAPADPRALAEALLAGFAGRNGEPAPPKDAGQLEFAMDLPDEDDLSADVDDPAASVEQHAGHLSEPEQALLLAAIEEGSPVEISYTNAQGASSIRVVEPIDVAGRLLVAWCQLREEERAFALDRIHTVEPA